MIVTAPQICGAVFMYYFYTSVINARLIVRTAEM